ncbi:MAG: TlpA family protein disulfide reductase [Myxococcales bacterium]|nr:TlpA family protein disulfide reductase [Myxococcales bacterium]MCB9647349.1 TlpA family protein disulfide reductase [Deltaproteobacteria bacterium]
MTHYTRRTFIAGTALALTAGPGLAWAGATQTLRLEAGKPVPQFKLRTPKEGHVYYLKDFAFPGKPFRKGVTKHPVLLDFFRTDCEPCKKSLPELVKMHESYAARGLKVVLVALHEQTDGKARLKAFLEKNPVPFLVLEDPTDFVAERYLGKTVSLPATFLIDQEGVLKKAKYDAKTTMQEAFGAEVEALLPAEVKAP